MRGELKLELLIGDRPTFAPGEQVQLRMAGGSVLSAVVSSLRPHAGRWLVAFDGALDPDAAQRYVGAHVLVRSGDLPPLGDGEYYDHQLIGCTLVDVAEGEGGGRVLGSVVRVEHWPASDVLVLDGGAMVPLVHAYEPIIDVAARRITMSLPVGLVDPGKGEQA